MDWAERLARKREELKRLRVDIRNLSPSIRDFTYAVTTQKRAIAVVGELAHASPEEGALAERVEVPRLLAVMDETNVSAAAVATEGGSGELSELVEAGRTGTLPVLQHDLVLTKEQVYLARQSNADALLLHASAVQPGELRLLIELAASTHMATPVEVRTGEEASLAVACGARLFVIPAFRGAALDLALADALLPKLPRTSTAIVRGPFARPEDFEPLRGRADAIWICGPLMRAPDPAEFLRPFVAAAEG